ncbi:hypothetical protein FZC84_05435 [Rossellomorea vietnamensis]|uniref:Uncharacterized protein n=1 Tax=Rossellomorea vietnamensis TaxID=218284 RepID=A0A5D4MHY4_9BACI|nr:MULTISPECIES: hypothetical protein [Bacillaceae]TYS00934.1 hypothetical protein FZC84_05435 [Rossellomorea vietnamensis]
MRKKYNPYVLPPWLRTCRNVCKQFSIPFCVFQGIRTILIPTTFDVLLLAVFIGLALAFYFEWL